LLKKLKYEFPSAADDALHGSRCQQRYFGEQSARIQTNQHFPAFWSRAKPRIGDQDCCQAYSRPVLANEHQLLGNDQGFLPIVRQQGHLANHYDHQELRGDLLSTFDIGLSPYWSEQQN